MTSSYHQPVMLQETIHHLAVLPQAVYLDATAGGGGHTAALLERLDPDGLVVALDRDSEAHQQLEARFAGDSRVVAVRADFGEIGQNPDVRRYAPYAGILFDFGVSSHQIDDATRGFSFGKEGPLDMRMDDRQSLTAADVVNDYSESDLVLILREFGEEPRAKRVAAKMIEARPIETTRELVEAIRPVAGGPQQVKMLARVFQAIRIEVNGELESIDQALPASVDLLQRGGRLVTLAYHSLEDRRVKEFMRKMTGEREVDPFLPPSGELSEEVLRLVSRKAIKPSAGEIEQNPRARSARLRVAEKVG
ncbi:16S rRNA (cytosine(1402)-N(4))-methyltransferase RsmH [bacterium]|nr:16S rRNA (cytosine(1402)-N(4))-methyltransferase RsmH [bacterium]